MKTFWRICIPLAAPVLLASTAVFADDLQKVRSAVNSFLIKAGSGLVSNESMCPSTAGNLSEYVTRIEFVPVDATTNALLLSSETCGGGNKHGQYLYIAKSWGGGELVIDAEIGDLSFIGAISHVKDGVVYLVGKRWMPIDPHRCPSTEATLEYNVLTKKHIFSAVLDAKKSETR
ncbi:MAG: hypothetical protein ACR652_21875 [Methylocystis sp.]|uniref:hypothetical protein n=1 Tax=Methylocystis sp. TaxID=1911079 RepID=UPI003DA31861